MECTSYSAVRSRRPLRLPRRRHRHVPPVRRTGPCLVLLKLVAAREVFLLQALGERLGAWLEAVRGALRLILLPEFGVADAAGEGGDGHHNQREPPRSIAHHPAPPSRPPIDTVRRRRANRWRDLSASRSKRP